jgi:hypothetical protein
MSLTPGGNFSIDLNQKDIARVKRTLSKYQGAALQKRMERGTLQAARLLLPAVRDAAPVWQRQSSFIGPIKNAPGRLKQSIKAYQTSKRSGLIRGARVGPVHTPYSVPLIRGHKMLGHKPGKRDLGRYVTGNPFVDRATAPRKSEAIRIVSQELFKP